MTWLITLLGTIIVLLGLAGLVQPDRFRALFEALHSSARFGLAVGVRLAFGALLWWLAEDLRHPQLMRIIAVIAVVAAVAILLMGRARLNRLVDWWLGLDDGLLRLSAVFAAAFGAFLVYAAT